MDSTDIIFIVLSVLTMIMLIVIERIVSLNRELTDMHIRLLSTQREQAMRYQLLLDQIKRHSDKPRALDELQHIFKDKINQLRRQYPALTDTDVQVLVLIGLGLENHEILAFTNMSKRTYYKRRQLIAQRMNTTAAQLDTLAKQLFAPNV